MDSILPFSTRNCLIFTVGLFANAELVTKTTILPVCFNLLKANRISCHSPSVNLGSDSPNSVKNDLSGNLSITLVEGFQVGIVKIRSNNSSSAISRGVTIPFNFKFSWIFSSNKARNCKITIKSGCTEYTIYFNNCGLLTISIKIRPGFAFPCKRENSLRLLQSNNSSNRVLRDSLSSLAPSSRNKLCAS